MPALPTAEGARRSSGDSMWRTSSVRSWRSWEFGALAGFGGRSAGAKFGQETDLNAGDFFNAALAYGFGAANVSAGYVRFNPDEGDDNNLFTASGDVGLLPGVTLMGDVTYATDDPDAHDNEDDPDATIAGVVTVQLGLLSCQERPLEVVRRDAQRRRGKLGVTAGGPSVRQRSGLPTTPTG
jgi:hypothetical protein